ncbi:hypothetical protein ACHAPT_006307 [Fusarium lateritium]
MALPSTMNGLVHHEDNSVTFEKDLPVPSLAHGSAIVQVLANMANTTFFKMVGSDGANALHFTQPKPLIPGANCIARVAALGPDAVSLKVGQLVAIDNFIRARDDPNVNILWTLSDGQTEASKKLHRDVWRNGTYADYAKAPLENIYPLDEQALCGPESEGGLGYSIQDLLHILPHGVPYGGLRSIHLEPGETLVISPATGLFSGSAVSAAHAMGAKVIAVSRSTAGLEKLKAMFPSIRTVQATGDVKDDTAAILAASGKNAPDAFLELGPPASTGSTIVTSCMLAVKSYGRIVLMGGRNEPNIPIPWGPLLYRNLTVKGGFMYQRQDIQKLVQLAESGHLKLGKKNGFEIVSSFSYEDWEKCGQAAIEHTAFARIVALGS